MSAARSRHARRRTARELLERAVAGSREDSAVLQDVLAEHGEVDLATDLGLALVGRLALEGKPPRPTPLVFSGRTIFTGDELPPHLASSNLDRVFQAIRRRLFPRRRGRCLPSRAALRALFITAAHVHAWDVDDRDIDEMMRSMWPMLVRACEVDTAGTEVMAHANRLLAGFGVETLVLPVRRAAERWGLYVDTGDHDNPTLFWDGSSARFYITTYNEVVARWERRYGSVHGNVPGPRVEVR